MTIEYIIEKSKQFSSYEKPEMLFRDLNQIDSNLFNDLSNRFSKDFFGPVVLLRFLILQKLIQNEVVNQETIDELKQAIESRDVSKYYALSDTYQNSLKDYKKSDRGMFPQWKDPFAITYPFFYSKVDKIATQNFIKELGNQIIQKYNIEDAVTHAVGFEGSQNYGANDIWGAIIPKVADGVQSAYQIFFRYGKSGITGGLYLGHKQENKDFSKIFNTYTNWDNYLNDIEEIIPKWKELNSTINFSLENDEKKFKKLIKKSTNEDLNVFFNTLDNLIEELAIPDNDKLVFSLGNNRLSFQIGKRICLLLNNDKFDFITSKNHDLTGVKKTPFTAPENAFLYENVSSSFLMEHENLIIEAVQSELDRDNHTEPKSYDNLAFRKAVFDNEYRSKFFVVETQINNIKKEDVNTKIDLNQIFFGPPGTGKTYHTINEAIKIVDPEFFEENKEERDKLKERFKSLLIKKDKDDKDIGQIGFTTFHQSFSYEDFIEGIKPVEPKKDDTYLKYKIEDGVFKDICRRAKDSLKVKDIQSANQLNLSEDEYAKAQFFKISLGNTLIEEDKEIYDYCINHSCITIGFGKGKDLTGFGKKELELWGNENNIEYYEIRSLDYFKNFLKAGNYVIVSNGNKYIRAIGKVVGDYEYKESPFDYDSSWNHFRKVEWILTFDDIPVMDVYFKNFVQKTIYKLEKSEVKKDFFIKSKISEVNISSNKPKNYVLIIDEINRGNVSSIFGELITLIEKDKRAGKNEELSAILPYSKIEFKVPHNVYIIGTMNTADRSIEALDTALRRRFSFREMPPKYDVIKDEGKSRPDGKIENGSINLIKLLKAINTRIEKLIDKDHKIGHSYFMGVQDKSGLERVFKDKVIPLLEEYFFGDFGKIGLVLGDSFVEKTDSEQIDFAEFSGFDDDLVDDFKQRPMFNIKKPSDWNYRKVYAKRKTDQQNSESN